MGGDPGPFAQDWSELLARDKSHQSVARRKMKKKKEETCEKQNPAKVIGRVIILFDLPNRGHAILVSTRYKRITHAWTPIELHNRRTCVKCEHCQIFISFWNSRKGRVKVTMRLWARIFWPSLPKIGKYLVSGKRRNQPMLCYKSLQKLRSMCFYQIDFGEVFFWRDCPLQKIYAPPCPPWRKSMATSLLPKYTLKALLLLNLLLFCKQ